jgi:2',3'-cyclic-nucleotide 2'-phosphodiesterase/3'-nucleotidase
VASVIAPYHSKAVAYVNQVIATSVAELPAAKSRYQDTPIIDYIQAVQTQTVTQALAGGPLADKKVLSIAAPFSRSAVFPKGDITVRDMAGLYIYDNTLKAVTMTGDQVKDYLEYSAGYFAQVTDGTFDPATDTNAPVNGHPQPDYNYDIISGLNYTIDVSKPVGQRVTIKGNSDGTPYDPGTTYVVAVNNYRQSGGGGFPNVSTAPVVYDEQAEIRQLLIDWASARGVIDPADFYVENWYLTVGDVRIA